MWEVFLLPKILFSISSISASIHNHNPHLSSASKFKRKNSNLQKKGGDVKEGEKLPTKSLSRKQLEALQCSFYAMKTAGSFLLGV
jgi:hypothetical protein